MIYTSFRGEWKGVCMFESGALRERSGTMWWWVTARWKGSWWWWWHI